MCQSETRLALAGRLASQSLCCLSGLSGHSGKGKSRRCSALSRKFLLCKNSFRRFASQLKPWLAGTSWYSTLTARMLQVLDEKRRLASRTTALEKVCTMQAALHVQLLTRYLKHTSLLLQVLSFREEHISLLEAGASEAVSSDVCASGWG